MRCSSADRSFSPELGDPADDLLVAHLMIVMEDRLVILQPGKSGSSREVVYQPQPLPNRAYRFWLHPDTESLPGDSLWVHDGQQLQVYIAAGSTRWTHAFDIPLGFEPLRIDTQDGTIVGLGSHPLKSVDLTSVTNAQRVSVSISTAVVVARCSSRPSGIALHPVLARLSPQALFAQPGHPCRRAVRQSSVIRHIT